MSADSDAATLPISGVPAPGLTRGVTLAMAIACGMMVANIYYSQPLLGIMLRDFHGLPAIAFVPTATQLGYAAGIVFLVPLGDRLERRALIVGQIGVLALALLVIVVAPGPAALLAGSALMGVTATVAQQIIPFAAELAAPDRRGAVLGTVMSGLLCGILFGRAVAGAVGEHFGWRAMFAISIVVALGTATMLGAVLPRSEPKTRLPYPALLRSLFSLIAEEPRLRRATGVQTFMFASFSAFWTVLALKLERPPYSMGADIAGLFGILGAAGILAAPLVGKVADRRDAGIAIRIGIGLLVAGWALIGVSLSVAALIAGVILLDIGVQATMIPNQHAIFALRPEARNRINTVFMAGIFLGAALGSAGSSLLWARGGWTAVCLYGGALAGIGLLIDVLGNTRSKRPAG